MRTIDRTIIKLIESLEITDQKQLSDLLKNQGFDLTQSALSRRLQNLSIEKRKGRYEILTPIRLSMAQQIIASPPNLIVIQTLPGNAGTVAYQLDELQIPEIAGTLAGDDIVMVALRRAVDIDTVIKKLDEWIDKT